MTPPTTVSEKILEAMVEAYTTEFDRLYRHDSNLDNAWIRPKAMRAALAVLTANGLIAARTEQTAQQKPVAWIFELARVKEVDGTYTHWMMPQISFEEPNVPAGSIRNVRRLYERTEQNETVRDEEVSAVLQDCEARGSAKSYPNYSNDVKQAFCKTAALISRLQAARIEAEGKIKSVLAQAYADGYGDRLKEEAGHRPTFVNRNDYANSPFNAAFMEGPAEMPPIDAETIARHFEDAAKAPGNPEATRRLIAKAAFVRALNSARIEAERERDEINDALRVAFPHFQEDAPINATSIAAIGKEYTEMLMGWQPIITHIQFADQNGTERNIVWEDGDDSVGIGGGWMIDGDWEVIESETAISSHALIAECLNTLCCRHHSAHHNGCAECEMLDKLRLHLQETR